MLPKPVTDLTDVHISAFDSTSSPSQEVNNADNATVVWRVQSGLGPSGIMLGVFVEKIKPYLENRATFIRDKLKESISALDLEPYPELATDLKLQFENYMAPAIQAVMGGFDRIRQMTKTGNEAMEQGRKELSKTLPRYKAALDSFAVQHTTTMKKRKEQSGGITYVNNLYGANARVNIGSQDYSTNISESGAVFEAMKKTITESIEDEDLKTQLITKTDELQASIGKPSAWKTYNEWVAIAANHMQVLGPFTPILMAYLKQTGIV